MNETAADRAPTSVRLDPDVREALDAFCDQTRRSRTSAINYLLGAALLDRGDQAWELPTHRRSA